MCRPPGGCRPCSTFRTTARAWVGRRRGRSISSTSSFDPRGRSRLVAYRVEEGRERPCQLPRSLEFEELFEIGLRELLRAADVFGEDCADQLSLLAAELEDLLLDGALGDQLVVRDDLGLSDAVRAIRRLIF